MTECQWAIATPVVEQQILNVLEEPLVYYEEPHHLPNPLHLAFLHLGTFWDIVGHID